MIPVPIIALQTSSHLARAATSSTLHETDICQPPAPKASSSTRAERTRDASSLGQLEREETSSCSSSE